MCVCVCVCIRTGPERDEMEIGTVTNIKPSSQSESHVYVNIFNTYILNQIFYHLLEYNLNYITETLCSVL
jgi:hypothetical protein